MSAPWITEVAATFGPSRGKDPSSRSERNRRTRQRLSLSFTQALLMLLCGYALVGKVTAYIGVPPVFVGEIVLALGLLAWASAPFMGLRLVSIPAAILMMFMAWGALRTLPYVSTYKVDALRDGVIWGYGLMALAIARVIGDDEALFARVVKGYKRYIPYFLTFGLFFFVFCNYLAPNAPGMISDKLVNPVKGGDFLVHLAGVFCFLSATRTERPWHVVMIAMALAINLSGRAGMVAFCMAALIISILAPSGRAIGLFTGLAIAGVGLLWASGISIRHSQSGREISFDQLVTNVMSVAGNSNSDLVEGTKKWRLKWWDSIMTYTFQGPYFWKGKGFGINLANDDGFQVNADESLRSPHNGHLTLLARGGVPALGLWIAVQLSWLITMLMAWWRAKRQGHAEWVMVFAVLIAYWASFLVNTTFDVFLEGPVGGIWFWSVFGVGLAAVRIANRQAAGLDRVGGEDWENGVAAAASPATANGVPADAAAAAPNAGDTPAGTTADPMRSAAATRPR